MEGRHYYQLREPLSVLCAAQGKRLPTRDSLRQLAVQFPFEKAEFASLTSKKRGPFSDGMLEAVAAWLEMEPHEFIRFTTQAPQHLCLAQHDVFQHGWDRLVLWLSNNREYVVHERSYLDSEQDVRQAAREMQLALGWQVLKEQNPEGNLHDHELLLEASLQRNCLGYESNIPDLMVEWWRVNRLTCMTAFDLTERRCGMTCLLPITESAYQRIRTGRQLELDLRAGDIVATSNRFLTFGGTEYAYRLPAKYHQASTRAVVGCFLAQLAHCVPIGGESDLRSLSFAMTNIGRSRLEACGHERVPDQKQVRAGAELYEFTVDQPGAKSFLAAIGKARHWIQNPRKRRAKPSNDCRP
ncbi:MAG: hypothetical protein IT422_18625 [Pirellulaceae bacterium]|nr:hypothetical protein [Pirellulaceae bacterium]